MSLVPVDRLDVHIVILHHAPCTMRTCISEVPLVSLVPLVSQASEVLLVSQVPLVSQVLTAKLNWGVSEPVCSPHKRAEA